MFGFGKKKKRTVDKAAWAAAVFGKPVQNPEKLSEKELEGMTDMMIYQYHRIIMESYGIIQRTKNEDTRQGRIDLCLKNYEKMLILQPFSNEEQLARTQECQQVLQDINSRPANPQPSESHPASTMTWEHLYEHYQNWSDSTLVKRLSMLKDYGATDEVIEVAEATCDEKAASRLIRNAMNAGVQFTIDDILELDGTVDAETIQFMVSHGMERGLQLSYDNIFDLDGLVDVNTLNKAVRALLQKGVSLNADQIMDLDGLVDTEVLNEAAKASKAHFTPEEMEDLDGIVDEDILIAIDKRQGTMTFDYDEDEEESQKEDSPGGLFTAAATFGMFAETGKKSASQRFRVGDHVRVKYRGQEGTIIDINGPLYMVSLNNGRHVDSYDESQLEKAW